MIDLDQHREEEYFIESLLAPIVIGCVALVSLVVWWAMP